MEHTPLTNILPVLSDILVIRYSLTQFALYQTDWTELQVQQWLAVWTAQLNKTGLILHHVTHQASSLADMLRIKGSCVFYYCPRHMGWYADHRSK